MCECDTDVGLGTWRGVKAEDVRCRDTRNYNDLRNYYKQNARTMQTPCVKFYYHSGAIDHACSVSGPAAPSVTDLLKRSTGGKMHRYARDLAHVEEILERCG